MKITKKTDKIIVNNIAIMLYGVAGIGKTSIGQLAHNPITLDFDEGIYRSAYRKDTIEYEECSYSAICQKNFEALKQFKKDGYQTLVIDNMDNFITSISDYIISNDSKYGTAKFSMQLWGMIKKEFHKFNEVRRKLGMDFFGICHADEAQNLETKQKYYRPRMSGGSYAVLEASVTFIGLYYYSDGKRVLDFNGNEFRVGKNSAKIPPIEVPNFDKEPNFVIELLDKMKHELNNFNEEQKEKVELLTTFREKYEAFTELEEFNKEILVFNEMDGTQAYKMQFWKLLTSSAEANGYVYNKEIKQFEVKE